MPTSDPSKEETSSPLPKQSSFKPLLNSNGWDGKLRHPSKVDPTSPSNPGRKATLANPEVLTDPEYSDPDAPPPESLPADEDLLDDLPLDSTDLDLVHCRISSISALKLSRFPATERLCLRQNAISSIRFPEGFGEKLQELDFYDNLIKHVDGLESFAETLGNLDLSFNKIKHIRGVNKLKELKELYFVQNRIQKIDGLHGLDKLRILELAANRIRVSMILILVRACADIGHEQDIENLETLTSIRDLWLGKNKITEIKVRKFVENPPAHLFLQNLLTSSRISQPLHP
jgi:protein phosphatase 1 regulatory subunit 7